MSAKSERPIRRSVMDALLSLLDQSYLQRNAHPASALLDVDAGEPILAAVVLGVLRALLNGATRHDCGRVAVDMNDEVGDLTPAVPKRAGLEALQDLALGAKLAALGDERVVVGCQPLQRGDVARQDRPVPFELDRSNLVRWSLEAGLIGLGQPRSVESQDDRQEDTLDHFSLPFSSLRIR